MIVIERISISRGLVELKLLDKRISSTINGSDFISAFIGNNDTTINEMSKSDVHKNIKAAYQSVTDLIKRRNLIKQRIVESNAKTMVTINRQTYTIAGAIERKSSIQYDKELLARIKERFATVTEYIIAHNGHVEDRLNMLLGEMVKGESNKSIEQTSKVYHEMNDAKIFDPLKVEDKIEKLEEEIYIFELEVDTLLSESNAITMIELQ